MERALLVGFGGFLGTMVRYLVGVGIHRAFPRSDFPFATLAVNVAGCALIGVIGALADVRGAVSEDMRAFLVVGLLGGFTTFSAFAYDTMLLFRAGEPFRAALNVALQLGVCMAAVWLGYAIARSAGVT